MAANIESALAFAERGFRVFPLVRGQKRPALKGWQDKATTDPQQIKTWFDGEFKNCDAGTPTGHGWLVFDADVKNGARGLQSFELAEMLGIEFSLVVATPSGGRHGYLKVPDGGDVPTLIKELKDYPGVDIKGEHGLVVVPGGLGANGKPYELIAENEHAAPAQWFVDQVRKGHKPRELKTKEAASDLDTQPAVDRAIAYLENNAPEAIEGANGDRTTIRVINHIFDYGITPATALDLLLDHWNEIKALPPWPPEDLEGKVKSAYSSRQTPLGSKNPQAEFQPVDEKSSEPPLAIAFAEPKDFIGRTPPIREWIVEGAIPKRHVTLLYGDGGLGKTLLAQQLASSMALSRDWMGRHVVGGKTLCVFSEDDTDEIWRRQVDINRQMEVEMDDLGDSIKWWTADHVAATGCVLMNFNSQYPSGQITPFFRRLEAAVEQLRPALVIVDPVANMFGGSEIDRAQVTGFVNRTLKRLCVQHDTTVLALAHPSVAGMTTGTGMSGSTGWNNAVRSRLYLKTPKTDPTGDYRELEGMKANYGKRGRIALMRWSSGAFVVATGSSNDPELAADRSLLAALRTMVERGDILSNSARAGNYAVRRAMALPEVDGLSRQVLEASLERLFRSGNVRMSTTIDSKKREQQTLIVEAATADEFEAADDEV